MDLVHLACEDGCHVAVSILCLFLVVPGVGLSSLIVAFPGNSLAF